MVDTTGCISVCYLEPIVDVYDNDGALVPIEPKFVEVKDTLFVEPLQCTDNLMNIITEKLPKPAKA